MGKVLVIGLDAATLDLVGPWAEAGKLPLFAQLMREGAYGTLWSTIPAMSPPAWTSIITGQNPGKHGLYDFVRRQPHTYRLQSMRSDFTRYRTIFDLLSAYGKRVAAINIPMTYPPVPVNGIMISGLGAPAGSGGFTYPAQLREELLSQGHRLTEFDDEYVPGQDEAYVSSLIRSTQERGQFALDLLQRESWDLFFVVFREIDEAQSFLWHHMDPTHPWHDPALAERLGDSILRVYQATEKVIHSLIETVDAKTTTFIVSDHGGGSLTREVYLNAWLHQNGWLALRQPRASSSLYRKAMRRLGLTRDSLSGQFGGPWALKLRRIMPLGLQHALLPSAAPTLADAIDWSQTKAYSFGYVGQIYVNLHGREPMGIVQPGREYQDLLAEITQALYQLVDPEDGGKVVDRVYRRDEIYHGPYAELGADLNVIMRDMSYITHLRRELASTDIFGPVTTNESGTHRPNGLAIVSGDDISGGVHNLEANVVDVTPTILSVMGIPRPSDLDGRVWHEALRYGPEEAQSPSSSVPGALDIDLPERPIVSEWENEKDEEAVMERLRRLGYLE
jgi:predicted AlkP superfamily phosphohydrolase/phosphomutase